MHQPIEAFRPQWYWCKIHVDLTRHPQPNVAEAMAGEEPYDVDAFMWFNADDLAESIAFLEKEHPHFSVRWMMPMPEPEGVTYEI